MTFFFLLLESAACLAIWYLIYQILLAKSKQFQGNRFYLLVGLVVSVCIPLLNFQIFPEEIIIYKMIPEASQQTMMSGVEASSWTLANTFWLIYLVPALILTLVLFNRLWKISKLVSGSEVEHHGDHTRVFVGTSNYLASFGKYLFLGQKTDDYSTHQIEHELHHIRQRHTIDVLIFEFYKIVFWFNPVVWLYEKAIRVNHEYLADQQTAGNEPKSYAENLLSYTIAQKTQYPMHRFHSFVQKRFQMLMTNQPKFARLRFLIILPALYLMLSLFSFSTYPVYVPVDTDIILPTDTVPPHNARGISQDSVMVTDTIVVFDSETFEETMTVNSRKISYDEWKKGWVKSDPGPQLKNDARSRLLRDSVHVIDTIVVFDSETFEETMTIDRRKISFDDWYRNHLKIDPMETIDSVVIFDPVDYSELLMIYDYKNNTVDTMIYDKKKKKYVPK